MTVKIKMSFPDYAGQIKRRRDDLNRFIAAMVQTNRGELFDSEGSHNGRPGWKPLKLRNGQILSDRGVLRKSIAPFNPRGTSGPNGIVRFSSDTITVGTKLIYARLMNDGTEKMPGGVLKPVRAKALKIPLPAGKSATDTAKGLRKQSKKIKYSPAPGVERDQNVIFRASVKIPARPFDDWNDQDDLELREAVANKIASIMNGRED